MTPPSFPTIAAYLCLGLSLALSSFTSAQQLSPAEAADSAREATGGKILKVKPVSGEKIDYRVKVLLPEGQVHNILVDGDNGDVFFGKNKAPNQQKGHKD